jgi:hypothetical protein
MAQVGSAHAQVQPPRFPLYGNDACPVPGNRPQTDGEILGDKHRAANGDWNDPFYGGDCSAQQYHDLYHNKQKLACDVAKQMNGCKGNDNDKANLIGIKNAWIDCANARILVAGLCFRGGDGGHQDQITIAYEAISKCDKFINKLP